MIVKLNNQDSYNFIQDNENAIIIFVSDFCGFYCNELVEQEYKESETIIGAINIDSGDELCKIVHFPQIMPVFVFF